VPFGRGALHLLADWKPSSPNLLDEPLKDFIVYHAYSLLKYFGSNYPGHMGNMTHGENVQPLQSVELL
jgi:hypothetical protein